MLIFSFRAKTKEIVLYRILYLVISKTSSAICLPIRPAPALVPTEIPGIVDPDFVTPVWVGGGGWATIKLKQ